MIDPKLNTLLAVYEQNSFTRAAELLSLTQPAVSQQIQKLEETYGCRIFERTKPELMLTREGELIIRTAYKIRSVVEEMKQELRGQEKEDVILHAGITHLPENDPITAALASFAPERGISFRITTADEERLRHMLGKKELDFYVAEGKPASDGLRLMPLDTDELVLIVPKDHPLADKKTVSIERVEKEKLILRGSDLSRQTLFAAALEKNGLSAQNFQIIMEIDSIPAVKDLVIRGFGCSVLPRSACSEELKQRKIAGLRIRGLSYERERYIVCRTDFEREDLLQEIIRACRMISMSGT